MGLVWAPGLGGELLHAGAPGTKICGLLELLECDICLVLRWIGSNYWCFAPDFKYDQSTGFLGSHFENIRENRKRVNRQLEHIWYIAGDLFRNTD